MENKIINKVSVNKNGKFVIKDKFPQFSSQDINSFCKKNNIVYLTINGVAEERDFEQLVLNRQMAIITIKSSECDGSSHTVFFDGEKIWDSWYNDYKRYVYEGDEIKYGEEYYKVDKDGYEYIDLTTMFYEDNYINNNGNIFKTQAPRQQTDEGYCTLFSLANARLRSKGKKLETMDKMLQAQKMRDELATFVEINSEMHVNGIKIFPNV